MFIEYTDATGARVFLAQSQILSITVKKSFVESEVEVKMVDGKFHIVADPLEKNAFAKLVGVA